MRWHIIKNSSTYFRLDAFQRGGDSHIATRVPQRPQTFKPVFAPPFAVRIFIMVATASSATTEMNSVQFSATSDHHGVNTSVGVVANVGVALGSDGNRSESPPTSEEPEYPMDLSSAAGHAALPIFTSATPPFMCAAPPTSTMVESILNARRLAEFVRAQQLQMKEEEHEDTPSKPIVPRKRAWPELQLDLSAMVSEKLKKSENFGHPSSPTESNSSSSGGTATPTSNKEVKKRRLDELLSKKFAVDVPSVESGDKPEMDNKLAARPPFSIKPAKNRRKKSITLSLRPNSELLAEKESEKNSAEKSEDEENEEKNSADFNLTLKNQQQLLQLHLAQAALMNQTAAGSNLFPGFFPSAVSGNGNNPLLYYGYYAQMIQGLQSQQQKLLQQLTSSGKKVR